MNIRRVRGYAVAKYPQGFFVEKPPVLPWAAVKQGVATAAMLLLLDMTEGCGTVGPPPIRADAVSESEARQTILQVFADNGVELEQDVVLPYTIGDGGAVDLHLDGFNETLQVGFEYLGQDDEQNAGEFTGEVVAALAEDATGAGPYIKTLREAEKKGAYQAHLEAQVQEFIDALKAQGVI